MTVKRMDEAAIDSSLDAYLHGAQKGDRSQALKLHEMLDEMLMEQEHPEGRLWLTEHGRMLLADMHRKLAHCDEGDAPLRDHVLEAVQFGPHKGHWKDNFSFVNDLRVGIAVANELCGQRNTGQEQDIRQAVEAVAQYGEFELDTMEIHRIYDEISETVSGFKEIGKH